MNLFTISSSGSGPRWRASSAPTGLPQPAKRSTRISAEPPRDASHGDVATNAAMVLAKPLGMKPRELALQDRGAARSRSGRRVGRGRRAGLRQSPPHRRLLGGAARDNPSRRRGLRPFGRRRRREGERRICLGQPDRADACRPLPRRRRRRRDRQHARGDRLRRDARILHQRCRRAGRCARPLRLPPLSRGARRRRSARYRAASIRAII